MNNWSTILNNAKTSADIIAILRNVLAQLDSKSFTQIEQLLQQTDLTAQQKMEQLQAMIIEMDSDLNVAKAAGAGANGWTDSLIALSNGRTQRSKNQEVISLLDFIPVVHHESILNYSYTVDVKPWVQEAINAAISTNQSLFVPAGGYLLDTSDNVPVYLSKVWGETRNLMLRGAGRGLTVFKEKSGATTLGGRFTKMFYFYYGAEGFTGNFGHIKFSGITFDKNGSSNTNSSTLYNYEQAHIIGFAGSGTVNIKSVTLDDIEFVDKIGAGINFSSAPNVNINKLTINNLYSLKHPKVTLYGDGTFGMRGCVELGTNVAIVDINSPAILYAQIEPVIASSTTVQRRANITGGKIDIVEWTDKGDYSFLNLTAVQVERKFLSRGIQCDAVNCRLKITESLAGGKINIKGGTILLDYDAVNNKVISMLHGQVAGHTDYAELWLSDLSIKIDSDTPTITPTGYAITGGTAGLSGSRKRFLNNVKFDSRLAGSIDAYGNGDWKIMHCDLHGREIQVAVGGTGEIRGGAIELLNNNFMGSGTKVHMYRNNTLWTLRVAGQYSLVGFWGATGTGDLADRVLQKPTLTASSLPPFNVFAPKGQIVLNSNAGSAASDYGWIKSETSTASTAIYKTLFTLA